QDFKEYVFPHSKKLFSLLNDFEIPKIYFGVSTGHLLQQMKECVATVLGLDWKVKISEAWTDLKYETAIQGNLDPALLLAPWSIIEKQLIQILNEVERPGFILNLGHGVMPQAESDKLKRITDFVHAWK